MNYVGIDRHKKIIVLCVVDQGRNVLCRKRLFCSTSEAIVSYFKGLQPFQAVVEATASHEWLFRLLEPLADRVVLAHPRKLRIIAESTRKNDKLDAQVLAEFLALDMNPRRSAFLTNGKGSQIDNAIAQPDVRWLATHP